MEKIGPYWILREGEYTTIGITNDTQDKLGEIVNVALPEIGTSVKVDDEIGILESTKAASDINSPITGTITEVNETVKGTPKLINADPEGDGWLFRIKEQG